MVDSKSDEEVVLVPLSERPSDVNLEAETSDTIYIRGISTKVLSDEKLIAIINSLHEIHEDLNSDSSSVKKFEPVEIDCSERKLAGSGSCYVKYSSSHCAHLALQALATLQFQGYFRGSGLLCSFHLGFQQSSESSPSKKKLRYPTSVLYNPVLRRVQPVGKSELEDFQLWRANRKSRVKQLNSNNTNTNNTNNPNNTNNTNTNIFNSTNSTEEAEATRIFNEADNTVGNPHRLGRKKETRRLKKQLDAERQRLTNYGIHSKEEIETILHTQFPESVFEYGGSRRYQENSFQTPEKTTAAENIDIINTNSNISTNSIKSADSLNSTNYTKATKSSLISSAKEDSSKKKEVSVKRGPARREIVDTDLFRWGWASNDGDYCEFEEEDFGASKAVNDNSGTTTVEDSDVSKKEVTGEAEGRVNPKTTKRERKQIKKERNRIILENSSNSSSAQQNTTTNNNSISRRSGKNPCVVLHEVEDVQYQTKSLVVNRKTSYPMPTGVYLTRVVKKMHAQAQAVAAENESLKQELLRLKRFKGSSTSYSSNISTTNPGESSESQFERNHSTVSFSEGVEILNLENNNTNLTLPSFSSRGHLARDQTAPSGKLHLAHISSCAYDDDEPLTPHILDREVTHPQAINFEPPTPHILNRLVTEASPLSVVDSDLNPILNRRVSLTAEARTTNTIDHPTPHYSSSSSPAGLLSLISNVEAFGGLKNYDKEISESMACVDAVERAVLFLA